MSTHRSRCILASLAALSTAVAAHAGPTKRVFVDASAPSGGDGNSWTSAFRDLQDALGVLRPLVGQGYSVEVSLAQGVYLPDRASMNRNATFELGLQVSSGTWFGPGAIVLKGGYAGRNAAAPDEQDPSRFVSVLSGDLGRNDAPNFANRGDNAYNVVTVANVTLSAVVLDGLTITGGNATFVTGPERGGGIYAPAPSLSKLIVRNCRVADNVATTGAGIWSEGPIFVERSTIDTNRATGVINSSKNFDRGAAGIGASVLYLSRSVVRDNTNFATNSRGGGICADAIYKFEDSTITGNAAFYGGGVRAYSYFKANRCIIAGNQASTGGALFLGGDNGTTSTIATVANTLIANNTGVTQAIGAFTMPVTFTSCTIANNTSGSGAGITTVASVTTFDSSIVWGNLVQGVACAASLNGGGVVVKRSIFEGGAGAIRVTSGATSTVAPSTWTLDPQFVDPVGTSSSPRSWQDKNYSLRLSSPGVDAGVAAPMQESEAGPTGDVLGNPRNINAKCKTYPRSDLGAYEVQSSGCSGANAIVRVRADAPQGGDGATWATAFRSPWEAAEASNVGQIWIARGTYTPPVIEGENPPLRIERGTFSILGGFAGVETSASQANPSVNVTSISGDLLGNDDGSVVSQIDNAPSLVRVRPDVSGASNVAISGLRFVNAVSFGVEPSGFAPVSLRSGQATMTDCVFEGNRKYSTITDHTSTQSDFSSGAVSAIDQSLVVDRCTFNNNSTLTVGGAIRTVRGRLTVKNSHFEGNTAGLSGGAICVDHPTVPPRTETTIQSSIFRGNLVVLTTEQRQGQGGAITVDGPLTIDRSTFVGNAGVSFVNGQYGIAGGAICIPWQGDSEKLLISQSIFSGNNVVLGSANFNGYSFGGAIISENTELRNCTFSDNFVRTRLGTVNSGAISGTNTIVYNSILASTSATTMPAQQISGSTVFATSIVQQIAAISPLSGSARNISPRFIDPLGPDGLIGTGDENFSLKPNSPAIDAASGNFLSTAITTDLADRARRVDAPWTPNTGSGSVSFLDIGAFEFQPPSLCKADFDGSGAQTLDDVFSFLSAWFMQDAQTDVNLDLAWTIDDVFIFLSAWFRGC